MRYYTARRSHLKSPIKKYFKSLEELNYIYDTDWTDDDIGIIWFSKGDILILGKEDE